MITLKTLNWGNCFSYGESNTLTLDDNIVTQVLGTNGVGKSSIPLIIEEVLYNKNSKGIKKADIPNRYVNKGYTISLTFSKDSTDYTISVARKASKISVVLLENGDDISSHTATNTYKTLQKIIGIDFKTFSQLVYQSTNASLQFLSATDTNRKKFLIDLLHLEEYLILLEVFKEAHKASTAATSGVRAQIATIEKWLSNNVLASTTLHGMLDFEINTDKDEQDLRHLNREIENIEDKNIAIIRNNKFKELLKGIDLSAVNSSKVTAEISYDILQTTLGKHSASRSASSRLLKKMQQLEDKCPTCEQAVDQKFKSSLIDTEQAYIAEQDNDIENIEREIREIKRSNTEFQRNKAIQQDWERIFQSIDNSLQTLLLDKGELDRQLLDVQRKLRYARVKMGEVAEENQRRTRSNTRIQVVLEQTEEFEKELAEAKEILDHQDILLSNLEVLKKAFSTNGILAYKIENLVKELEELTNTYLAELSDGRFTLAFIVSNDKLNVQITDNGNVVEIAALSSGELARVNTATLIAIRKLMSSISKSRINVLFLDEVIAVLDEAGREKLVEVLLGEDNLNTYIVSHQWEHPLLSKITVSKQDDISKVEI